ncbi:hypothetical protein HQ590_02755, partial [bacterium]|nr:hypothetical protein [bacterium]
DGRFVHFVPFVYGNRATGYTVHANFLRYDPQQPFDDRRAWQAHDASQAGGLRAAGYNAGAFDGRFFYCAPWHHGLDPDTGRLVMHGKILRVDTVGDRGSFSLRYCDYGHNGGLNAAVPGPSFLVNTDRGVRSVATHHPLRPGRHDLVGVYDGQQIRLFIDGRLAAQRAATGRIQSNDEPVVVGRISDGLGRFCGTIERVGVAATARGELW